MLGWALYTDLQIASRHGVYSFWNGGGHTMEANDCGAHGGQVKVKSRAIYVNRKWQLNLMATSFGL